MPPIPPASPIPPAAGTPAADPSAAAPDAGTVQITLTPDDVTQLKSFFSFLQVLMAQVDPDGEEGDDTADAAVPPAATAAPAGKANSLAGLGAELDGERRQ